MGLIEIIGLVGSIFSIAGAIYAGYEAKQAKGYSNKSEEIKEELMSFRKTSELAELKPILIAARDAMDKYCTNSAESLAGVNKVEDAKLIQKVINTLSEFGEHFKLETIATFNNNVDRELQEFVDADDLLVTKINGKNIHREISNLYGLLAGKLKEQQLKLFK
ncbi:hypothetical protein ACT3UM_06950 [Halomonas sp. AOP13-D3-9]